MQTGVIGTVCEDDINVVELESFQTFLGTFNDTIGGLILHKYQLLHLR